MTSGYTAIILAGGSGTRAGLPKPKQYMSVGGRTVLELTASAFRDNARISRIIIATNAEYLQATRDIFATSAWEGKRPAVCAGGATRLASATAALALCGNDDGQCVLIHDAARPLVSHRIISDVCAALEESEAVDVAVPATDSMILSDGSAVDAYLERRKVWRVQTPQGFRLPLLREAYAHAIAAGNLNPTDDCSLIRTYFPEKSIALVRGDEDNFKVTYHADLERVAQALRRREESGEE